MLGRLWTALQALLPVWPSWSSSSKQRREQRSSLNAGVNNALNNGLNNARDNGWKLPRSSAQLSAQLSAQRPRSQQTRMIGHNACEYSSTNNRSRNASSLSVLLWPSLRSRHPVRSFTSSSANDTASHNTHLRLPRVSMSTSHHLRRKTLVLDLDETLIHSTSRDNRQYDYMIEVAVEGHRCLYYVYKRPHVDFFLQKVAEWYTVVIFTASLSEYADPVIDYLDPKNGLIRRRFFRGSCTSVNGTYMKNLMVVEPDLSQVVLVDNSPLSYALNQDNGIPIEGWISDMKDEALLDLLPFLDALRFTEDVRSVLSLRLC